MPELPEVETIKNGLAPGVTGRRFTRINLLWDGQVRQPSPQEFRQDLAGQLVKGIHRRGKYLIFDLSGGQKKLVELGRALLGHPKLLLLDEPMAGVNPALAVELGNYLLGIRDRGVTILVIEHNMSFIRQICDHVIVLATGRVIAEGSFAEVRANETVQSAYFGSSL